MALRKAKAKKSEKKKPVSPGKSRLSKPKRNNASTAQHRPSQTHSDKQDFFIVGIGASAGGLKALHSFLSSAPEQADFALVFVQHLSRDHKSRLPELLLSREPGLAVMEIDDGVHVHPGRLYLCPPGKEVRIRDGVFHTAKSPARHAHLPIDEFFESLAADVGGRAIAVVLSGAGTDGARGIQAIRSAGGCVFVQEPGTAEFPGMPQAAIGTGAVDGVLPPEDILREIVKVLQGDREGASPDAPLQPEEYDAFYRLIQEKTGHRFAHYKKSVVSRRVRRRMYLSGVRTVAGYLDLVAQKDAEAIALAYDLMIGVTSFFRDRPAWQALDEEVLQKLAAELTNAPVRVWTPATATGEEAYSIAMALLHELARQGINREVQIFATDVNDLALEHAREGKYAASIAADIPREYVKMYFTTSADGQSIIVKKEVRERVIFAKQDLLTDPPFSRLDLIVCRNLLIYLEPDAQDKCMTVFHYALKPGGYLFLGNAESPSRHPELFRTIGHKKCRIYVKIATKTAARMQVAVPFAAERSSLATPVLQAGVGTGEQTTPLVQEALLEEYAPPAIAIDQNYTIVYHSGQTNRFLCQPRGIPTQNLLELLPEEFRSRIRSALYRARQNAKPVALRALVPGEDRRKRQVTFRVSQIRDNLFLIVFHEQVGRKGTAGQGKDITLDAGSIEETAVHQLETELAATRSDLQHHVEQFRSINEELHSSNEELQAANEELETSREELQSLNEELLTVNAQLQEKIEEQEETNNDLTNFLTSTNIPTVFLDHELKVKRFTPAMTTLIKLIPTDVGRPIADLSQDQLGPDLIADASAVLDRLVPVSKEIRLSDIWYVRSALPYRTADNRIEGVVVTYNDVTELKRSEERTRHLASFPQLNPNPVCEVDSTGAIIFCNPATQAILMTLGMEKNDVAVFLPADMDDILRTWNKKDELTLNREVVVGGRTFGETIFLTPQFNVARIYAYDITKRKQAEEALQTSEQHLRLFIEHAPASLAMFDREMRYLSVSRRWLSDYRLGERDLRGLSHYDIFPEIPERWKAIHRCGLAGEVVREDGDRFERLDGSVQWLRWEVRPWHDAAGDVGGIVVFSEDITERKQAEERLRESQQQNEFLAGLISASSQPVGTGYPDGRLGFANRAFEELTGYSADELRSLDWSTVLTPPEWRERELHKLAELERTGRPVRYEKEYLRKDGTRVPIELLVHLVADTDGKPLYYYSFLTDITERKQAEAEIRALAQQRQIALDAARLGWWQYNPITRVSEWDDGYKEIFGFSGYTRPNDEILAQTIHPDDLPALWAKVEAALDPVDPQPYAAEYRIIRPDGALRWIEAHGIAMFEGEGGNRRAVNFVGTVADITDRKQAQEALRLSENKYRQLFENMVEEVHFWQIIRDDAGAIQTWRLVDANPPTLKTWGRGSVEEIRGKTTDEIFGPGATEHFLPVVQKIMAEGIPYSFEDYFPNLDRHFRFTSVPLGDHFITTGADITDIKKAEQALRLSEEKFSLAFANNPAAIAMTRLEDGLFLDVNDTWLAVNGYSRDEVIGVSARKLPIWPSIGAATRFVQELREKGALRGWEQAFRKKSGEVFVAQLSAQILTVRGEQVILSTLVDITERKKAEEALRESEEQFRNLADSIPNLAWWANGDGYITWYNRRWYEYTGTTPEQMEGWGWQSVHDPDVLPKVLERWKASIATGQPFDMEFPLRGADGIFRSFLTRVLPLKDSAGLVHRWFGTNTDISALKEAEEAQGRLAAIVESADDAIIGKDLNGIIQTWNVGAENIFGYKAEEVIGKSISLLIPPGHIDEVPEILARIKQGEHIENFETLRMRKEGTIIPVSLKFSAIRDASGKVIGASKIAHDITERRRAQEALRESEERVRRKLDSIISPEGDIGDLDLADIIDTGSVQTLMDDFYKLAHMPMSIIDLKGRMLVGVGWQKICTEFHRAHPETCRNCTESDLQLSAGVPPGEFKLYKCKNNMWDVATPIVVSGKQLGNLFMGQFFFEDEPLDYDLFRAQARQYGFDEKEYLAALEDVPRLRRTDLDTSMAFFRKLAGVLSKASYGTLKLARVLAEREALTDSLRASEERFRSMFERHQAVMLLIEPESGAIVDANAAASLFYGYPREQLRAMRIQDINQLSSEDVDSERKSAAEERRNYFIFPHRLADGRDRWVEVYSTPFETQGRSLLFSVIHDITERRRAEEALHKSGRALKAVSNSREAVIRAEDEASFMHDVCTIIVEDCGFSMVWIGYAENDEARSVRPVAHAGFEEGYLETLQITWADTERGRGPTGTAIRTGELAVCRNMLTDPVFTPWRDEALRRGYASSIVFPLWADDRVFGALTIYSKEADPFSEEEVKLLTELADDLAYGITTLRTGTARKAAETALRDSEAQLRTIFEQAAVGIVYAGLDGRFVRFNQRLAEITGYPQEELHQLTFQTITHPDDLEADLLHIRRLLDGEISSFSMDKRYVRKDGSPVWVNLAASLVRDLNGEPGYFIAIIEDIEARKRAQDQIQTQVEELTRLNSAMVGRELRMIELKKEVNELLGRTGRPLRYSLDFEKGQS